MALTNSSALTTLAVIKGELGIGDSSKDGVLERLVLVASDAIEQHCDRQFRRESVTERLQPSGGPYLILSRLPVVAVAAIREDGAEVNPAEYDVTDASAGLIYRRGGWPVRGARTIGVSLERVSGTGDVDLAVEYSGGYVLPNDEGTRNLPFALEQACIDTVVSLYRNRGMDRRVVSEEIGDASVSYGGVNTAIGRGEGGIIPDDVVPLLRPYRRMVSP